MDTCSLCSRDVQHTSRHHLVPECRGGKETIDTCSDCHSAIHSFFSNKQLETEYCTVEKLLSHEPFAKHIKWISKQPASTVFRTKVNKSQRHRGRNG